MPKPKRGCELSGESEPIKIVKATKYGRRKKSDEDRFECQRYAANPGEGFDRAVKKIKEKSKP
jgi:hypothetical protein